MKINNILYFKITPENDTIVMYKNKYFSQVKILINFMQIEEENIFNYLNN